MKSYCIYITFKTPQALHRAHNNNIKALNFILGDSHIILENAKEEAISYINDYLRNLDVTTPYITDSVPLTPTTSSEWKAKDEGYFCTEEACNWKLTVWHKKVIKGYLFNSFEIEEIFHIDILQVFEESCQGTPTKIKGAFNYNKHCDSDLTPIHKKRISLPSKQVRFGSVIDELKTKMQSGMELKFTDSKLYDSPSVENDNSSDFTTDSDVSEKSVSDTEEYED